MKLAGMLFMIIVLLSACRAAECTLVAPVRITSAQALEMMAAGDVVILDVRTPQEFAQGHIEGAVLIPVDEIETLAPTLLPDKGQTLLVYCRSGARSHQAALILINLGFTSVYDFGGILDFLQISYEPS